MFKKRVLQLEALEERAYLSASYTTTDYSGTFTSTSNPDTYAITTTESRAFSVQLSSTQATDISLTLYDSTNTAIAYGSATEDFRYVLNNVQLTAGTYTLAVSGDAIDNTEGSYRMSITKNASPENEADSVVALRDTLNITGLGIGTVTGSGNTIAEITQTLEGNVKTVAMDGNRFAILTTDTTGETSSATLWLYDFTGEKWERTNRLSYKTFNNIDPATFGSMMDLSGDYVMLSSGREVDLYHWNGVGFDEIALSQVHLTPEAIQLESNFAIISSNGSVLVYRISETGWQLEQELGSDSSTFGAVTSYDSVANRLYVSDTGTKTVTIYDCTTWESYAITGARDRFGWSLAADGDTLVIGASEYAFVYEYDASANEGAGTWELVSTLSGVEVASSATDFGISTAILGNQILVSAENAYNGAKNTGAIYLFQKINDTWQFQQEIFPKTDTVDNMHFGGQIFLQGSRIFSLASKTNTLYALTGYADIDEWELNVTGTSQDIVYAVSFNKPTSQTLMNVDVYAPDGTLVAHEETSGGSYSFTPTMTGTYQFVLTSANAGNCSYELQITSGQYSAELLSVVSTTPAAGVTPESPTEIEVTFSDQVLAASIGDSAASLNGHSLEFKEVLDGSRVVWSIPPTLKILEDTLCTVTLSGIQNVQENHLVDSDSYSYSFTYSTSPKIVSYSVAETAGGSNEIASYQFSKPVTAGSGAVQLTNSKSETIPVTLKFDSAGTTLKVTTTSLLSSEESYILKLNGADITDSSGNVVETDLTDVISAGLSFQNVLGTSVKQAVATGTISNTTTYAQYVVAVGANQSMNLRLNDELDNGLVFEVYNGSTLIASGSSMDDLADVNGQRISNIRPTTATNYTIAISSPRRLGVDVDYTLTVTLGAMEEIESNNSDITATDISGIGAAVGTLKTEWDQTSDTYFQESTQISVAQLDENQLSEIVNSSATDCVMTEDWAALISSYFVELYQKVDGVWTFKQEFKWVENEGTENETLISDVLSVAIDGNTLVVGHVNRVEVYTCSPSGVWSLNTTLKSSETTPYDGFGYSVAISGDRIAVSAPYLELADGTYNNAGKIYVYERSVAGSWRLAQELVASDRAWSVGFGASIVMDGDTLVTLSTSDYHYTVDSATGTGKIQDSGSVYVWKYDGSRWVETSRTSIVSLDSEVSLSGQGSTAWLEISDGLVALVLPNNDAFIYTADLTAETLTWERSITLSTAITLSETNYIYDIALRNGEIWCSHASVQTDAETGDESVEYNLTRFTQTANGWERTGQVWSFSALQMFTAVNSDTLLTLSVYEGFCASPICDTDYYSFVARSTDVAITITYGDDAHTVKTLTAADLSDTGKLTIGQRYTFAVTYDTTGFEVKEFPYVVQISTVNSDWGITSCTLSPTNDVVTVKFSSNVNLNTIAAGYSQLKLAGTTRSVSCTGYKVVDGQTIQFLFEDAVLSDGNWTFGIAKNLFSDLAGSKNAASSTTFAIDTTAPYAACAADGSTFSSNSEVSVTIAFNEAIDAASFVPTDIALVGENTGSHSILSSTLSTDGRTLRLVCGKLDVDAYTLTLDTATAFRDLAGNALATSAYTVSFNVEMAFEAISDDVSVASLSSTLSSTTDKHTYTVTLGANEMLSVVAVTDGTVAGKYTLKVTEYTGKPNAKVYTGTVLTDISTWVAPICNTSNAEKTYKIAISGIEGDYDLRISKGAIYGSGSTLETAVSLTQSTSAAGHVSNLVGQVFADATARNSLNGVATATDGQHLFVGASQMNSGSGEKSGCVMVYDFNGLEWHQTAVLVPEDNQMFDCFGSHILVMEEGKIAVAASNHANSTGTLGCIYLFEYDEATLTWSQTGVLVAPGASDSDFGVTMDYSNGRFVTGTQSQIGTSYVFTYNTATQKWESTSLREVVRAYLGSDFDPTEYNDPMETYFPYLGFSVSIEGNTIALAAPMSTYYDANGSSVSFSGVLFFLEYNGSSWHVIQPDLTLEGDDLAAQFADVEDGYLGFSTDICGDTLVASALRMGEEDYRIAIYTFKKVGSSWVKQDSVYRYTSALSTVKFYADMLNLEDEETLYVTGASSFNGVEKFKYVNGAWTLDSSYASPSDLNFSFGSTLDSAGENFIVGDPEALNHSTLTGAAYAYNSQSNYYAVTAANRSISVTASNDAVGVRLLNQTGAVVVNPSHSGNTWTFSNLTVGRDYVIEVYALEAQTESDYAITVTGTELTISSTLVQAQATEKKVVWTFEVPVSLTAGKNWTDVVSLYSSDAPGTNVAANGTFSLDSSGMILTWEANTGHRLSSDNTLTTTVDLKNLNLPNYLRSSEVFTLTNIAIAESSELHTKLVVTDASGNEVEWLNEWQNIQVQVWAYLEAGDTLNSFSATLNYTPRLYVPQGDTLQSGSKSFSFTNLNISATSDGYVLLGTVQMIAQGGVAVATTIGDLPSSSLGIFVTDISGTNANGVLDGQDQTDAASLPKVYPVNYDLDNNGTINLNDLLTLAKNYGQEASSSATAYNCDFDHNGSVVLNDLLLLAKNFSKTVGDEIVFDSKYPWTSNAIVLAPAGNAASVEVGVEPVAGDVSSSVLAVEETPEALTQNQLDTLSAAVVERATSQFAANYPNAAALKDVTFRLTDLSGNVLAVQIGNVIWIDQTAASCGWYVDETPYNDADDTALTDSERVDLLSVILHELGHASGLEHEEVGFMSGSISAGVRRLPSVMEQIFGEDEEA